MTPNIPKIFYIANVYTTKMEQKLACKLCNCTFTRKYYYNQHLKSPKHLRRASSKDAYNCSCGNTYLSHKTLAIHQKTCTYKCDYTVLQEEVRKQKEDYEAKIKELEEKIDHFLHTPHPPSLSQITNNNNTTTNTNSHNTTNNLNLQINAFGHENLDYITDGILNNCVNRVFESIPTLIEKIHFDPAHPENHTIKIPNKKLPHASVMSKDKEWKLMNKHEVIDNIMNNSYNMIDDKFNEDPSKFTEDRRKQYRRFQEKYDNEDKETMKRIKSDVEMVLMNGTKTIHSKKKCV